MSGRGILAAFAFVLGSACSIDMWREDGWWPIERHPGPTSVAAARFEPGCLHVRFSDGRLREVVVELPHEGEGPTEHRMVELAPSAPDRPWPETGGEVLLTSADRLTLEWREGVPAVGEVEIALDGLPEPGWVVLRQGTMALLVRAKATPRALYRVPLRTGAKPGAVAVHVLATPAVFACDVVGLTLGLPILIANLLGADIGH